MGWGGVVVVAVVVVVVGGYNKGFEDSIAAPLTYLQLILFCLQK